MAGSEGDLRTDEVWGVNEDVGNLVHVIVAYGKNKVTMYRNGQPYGTSYFAPNTTWAQNGTSRLVFGVRSTAYVPGNENEVNLTSPPLGAEDFAGKHATTHSPFFTGAIRMATVIRGELLADEVRGLYEHFLGGKERGCHCYDACPTAESTFHPGVPVPCGGHGVCLRNPQGQPFGAGVCHCLPGYYGSACQRHCSTTGCCKTDDDCLPGWICNEQTTSCTEELTTP